MILKIVRYVNNNDDWWMLDDIKKISKTQFKRQFCDRDSLHEEFDDIVILDAFSEDAQKECILVRLICRLSNGDEFSIVFDTIAYVLNDNGKTIEKIVANYL